MQDVELAITLLYQLGEGAAEETLKPGSGTLGQLATGTQPPQHLLYPQPFASGFTAFGSFLCPFCFASQSVSCELFASTSFAHLNILHLDLLHLGRMNAACATF